MLSIIWRVKGTIHSFCIYEKYLNEIAGTDYAKHFTEVLEKFREDYLSWWTEKEYEGCEWRESYRSQYEKLIKSEASNDNKS